MDQEDSDLMNELLAHLDSRGEPAVRAESATVLNEMNLNEQASQIEASNQKQDPKSRFKARQVGAQYFPNL